MDFSKVWRRFGLGKHTAALHRLGIINNKSHIVSDVQKGYSNFYNDKSIQPYTASFAQGPWIMTSQNKIIYDCGGYGMLGFGHNPIRIRSVLGKQHVMANMMMPNVSQKTFWDKLEKEIPTYSSIACLNSGSEINSLAMRIANIHTRDKPVRISLKNSFHGRTDKPAQVSDSCRRMYSDHLHDYSTESNTYAIKLNDLYDAERVFNLIRDRDEFPEITVLEPVQGEGNPGIGVTPSFYNLIREKTKQMNGLLLVDSVQAGWRCHGELSITRYPGFESCETPDMETFSKAINAGQYPLSVLALSEELTRSFKTGLYGNTMCGNPKALDVGSTVLDMMTAEVRENIRENGDYFLRRLKSLDHPCIDRVTGTGLLLAIHLINVSSIDVQNDLRSIGLNVITGGENAIRFTPWFHITKEEIDFVVEILGDYFKSLRV